jgi:hypothetical protein
MYSTMTLRSQDHATWQQVLKRATAVRCSGDIDPLLHTVGTAQRRQHPSCLHVTYQTLITRGSSQNGVSTLQQWH